MRTKGLALVRLAFWGMAAACLGLPGLCVRAQETAAAGANFDGALKPFLAEHCVRCHGEKKQKGDFRLDTLAQDFASPRSAAHWGDVMGRISAGEMPPEEENQPKAEDAARVAEWIAAQLKEGEAVRLAKRERVTFHKLTREEYARVLATLEGV